METPFQYGKSVLHSEFINRKEELVRLRTNFESGINTTIISPRRWGKSSLVNESARQISTQNKSIRFCFVDMFSIRTEEEFYEALAKAVIKAGSGKLEDWLQTARQFFNNLIPKLSVTVDPVNDIALSFDWKEVMKHRNEILDLAEAIAVKKKIKIIVCVDEFQNIEYFAEGDSFEKILRSRWQHHRHVTYCLYGSKRHMMNTIFNGPSKPFYRFGDVMYLEKIRLDHWIRYIGKQFTATGKRIDELLAEKIAETMKCHPYYVQQYAHQVWNLTSKKADEGTLRRALEKMLENNSIFYQKEVDTLSNTQINFIKAVIDGVEKFTSVDAMQSYKLGTPNNVSKNRDALEKADIIDVTGKRIELLDPAFELWFIKYYLKRAIRLNVEE